jgi:hypothetical protein
MRQKFLIYLKLIFHNLFCASLDELSCVSAMGGMPDERYLPSCLRISSLLLTGCVRKIIKQKSRKIIRRFTGWRSCRRLSTD